MNFFSCPFNIYTIVAAIHLTVNYARPDCHHDKWKQIKKKLTFLYEDGLIIGNFADLATSLHVDRILGSPEEGFECATGSAAVLQYMAAACEKQGDNLRALRFRQMSSIYASFDFQMKGQDWFDSSGWPVSWKQTIESVLRNMMWFRSADQKNIPSSRTKSHISVAIVTVCDYDSSATPLSRLSRSNKDRYADKHGHKLYFFDQAPIYRDYFSSYGQIDPSAPHAWRKIDALLTVMSDETVDADWIMWMDCDSYFMNASLPLATVLGSVGEFKSESPQHDIYSRIRALKNWSPSEGSTLEQAIRSFETLTESLTEESKGRTEFVASEDGLMLNTGIFFVTRSVFSFHFLWRVRSLLFRKSPVTFHPWWEQTGIMMLISAPYLSDEQAWDSVKNNLGFPSFVRMLSQKQINTYPPLIAGMLSSHIPFENGDFIVSFSGCKSYTSQAVCNNLFWNYYMQSCDGPNCLSN